MQSPAAAALAGFLGSMLLAWTAHSLRRGRAAAGARDESADWEGDRASAFALDTPLVRLRPRPDTLHVSRGRSVLATGPDGFVEQDSAHGLFVHETRLLSCYRWLVHGRLPMPVALSNVTEQAWLGYFIAPPDRSHMGNPGAADSIGQGLIEASQHAVELRLSRFVGEGMFEDVQVTNFTQREQRLGLELEIDADFADQEEVTSTFRHPGLTTRAWRQAGGDAWELRFDHRATNTQALDLRGHRTGRIARSVILRVTAPDQPRWVSSPNPQRGGTIRFALSLPPGAQWRASVEVRSLIEGTALAPELRSFGSHGGDQQARHEAFLREATEFTAPGDGALSGVVLGALRQAKRDLASLRLFDLDHDKRGWTMAAGLPMYVSLFGRDTLTAAWQAALLGPEMMMGTIAELARWQGKETNDWRDEQPGRMIHEVHTGPLEVLNYNPRGRSYSSVTTSALFPLLLAELWHWTGDRALVTPWIETALRSIRWMNEHGDLDGDGLYEYRTRSAQGVKHQAWKDSEDAIVDHDGRQIEPPIATCEEQGFAYIGKLHMSELLWWMDRKDEARRLFREAAELKKRFNDQFWMEEEGFIALGLGPDKRPIRAITSNPGHCIATAILDADRAPQVAERMFKPDLFSGWGIRTLSSDNPAYNPYSYHRGSIWPVEHGTFAIGFARYGLWSYVERICRAQFETAALFDFHRLPECLSGHPRDAEHPFPALYPKSNWPQAWSSSAVFNLLQAMLGLYPYAPLRTLVVDPHLPDWLPEITLHRLRVGRGSVSIRFFRKPGGASDYEVLQKRGHLHILRQPSPWSLTASWPERTVDLLSSVLPGH